MQTKHISWLSLVGFCASAALVAALVLAMLFASATMAFAVREPATSARSEPKSAKGADAGRNFSGVISDAVCGARHASDSDKSPAQCARACVRKGSQYVLVNGDTMYILMGNTAEFANRAGQRVSVRGTLEGETIHVSSLSAD